MRAVQLLILTVLLLIMMNCTSAQMTTAPSFSYNGSVLDLDGEEALLSMRSVNGSLEGSLSWDNGCLVICKVDQDFMADWGGNQFVGYADWFIDRCSPLSREHEDAYDFGQAFVLRITSQVTQEAYHVKTCGSFGFDGCGVIWGDYCSTNEDGSTQSSSVIFKTSWQANGPIVLKDFVPPGNFLDVPLDHWAIEEILSCAEAGIVEGYPGFIYQPNNPVTRDQMAVFVQHAFHLPMY